ncbi:MAG: glycoside hydrolase family 28 protein [Planctomycetota bacterium]
MATHRITDHGARGDGTSLATVAIQQAIDAAAADGGGTVVVPQGVFVTGALFLRDRVTLHLDAAAVLRASHDLDHYRPLAADHNVQQNVDLQPYHLLVAHAVEDVAITGRGTIDGQGPAFWDPPSTCAFFTAKSRRVSPLIELRSARRVRLEGVTIADAPGWTVHVLDCHDVRVRDITIANDLHGPNTDGIDVTDSSDVIITSSIITAGDDAIVLKSLGGVNERIVVSDCILHTNCSALKLGAAESIGIIRQVAFSNCIIHDSSRGVHLACMAGGTFEDVTVSNILCDTHGTIPLVNPIHIDCSVHPKARFEATPGRIRRVRVDGVTVRSDARVLVTAGPGAEVRDIQLRNIHLHYPAVENEFAWAREAVAIQFSPGTPAARGARAAVVAENVQRLAVQDITIDWPEEVAVPMHVFWARNTTGLVDCPLASPSQDGVEKYVIEGAGMQVRG